MPVLTTAFASRALSDMDGAGEDHRTVRCTLVFADVSGFTPLTERYTRRGREGSELLTDLLNSLFGPTLDAALDLGGDLLSFGGDALLVQFTGDGHERSGLFAAHAMRDRFYEAARRSRARVGMSVGVASGEVHLHRVGRRFRTLVVHGPAVREVLRLESAAHESEILAGSPPPVLDALGATHRPGPGGNIVVDLTDRRSRPRAAAVDDPGGTDFVELVDPHVAGAIREGAGAEHRRTLVTFIRFAVDPAGTPTAVDPHLRRLMDVVEGACASTDVSVLNSDIDPLGGKLTLTAGVPFTTGDDADRMLQAALDIAAGLRDTHDLRLGVNEGPVFAGPVGSARRMSYTIMGDAVNLSARVAGTATTGTVLATEAVTDRARQRFSLEPVEAFHVKGKSEAVRAAIVHSADEAPEPLPATRPAAPLRGREGELARLVSRARSAERGDGSVIELVAEAGMGKTRLVGELRAHGLLPELVVEGGRLVSGTAYGALALAARRYAAPAGNDGADLASALRAAVRDQAPHLEVWLPFLGIPLGVDLPDTPVTAGIAEEFRLRRVHQVTAEFLTSVLGGPHLLLVEDAHWLDEASAELLATVVPEITEAGWVVVVTRRPEGSGWVPAEVTDRLALEPLDPGVTVAVAHDVAGSRPLPDHVLSRLVDRSQGNPLFVEQLVRSVTAGADPDELPDRVEVLIEARIDQLRPDLRATLRGASVLGARFERDLLEEVQPGATPLLGELGEFLDRRDGQVEFRHALYRDTAYAALPARQRRQLHAAAATAIEGRHREDSVAVASLLAEHWDRAGDAVRAWPYLRSAADRAQADLAPFEAARFLERAARSARRLPATHRAELPAVREQLGVLYDTLGRFADAESAFRAARRSATEPSEVARLLGREARVARSARSLSTAVRRYRRALEVVPAGDHRSRAELLVGLTSVYERQGRHRDKLPLLFEALEEAERAGDTATLAHTHLLIGNTYGDLGESDAVEHLAQALARFESVGHIWGTASARNNLGVEAYYAGDWDLSLEHYRAAADDYRRIGDESNYAMTLNNIGEIHSDQGRWDDAGTELEEARRMWQAIGFVLGVGLASSNLGRLAARRGDPLRAEEEFTRARDVLSGIHAAGFLLELDARVAAAHLAAGRPAAARTVAERTRGGGELQPTVRCQLLRVEALAAARLGERAEAEDLLQAAREVARTSGAAYETAACEAAAAQLGLPHDDPAAVFDQLGVEFPARRAW